MPTDAQKRSATKEGMARTDGRMEVKSLESPDETRTFDNGRIELVNVNGRMIGRAVFEPGWRWSESVKRIAKTESCEMPHFQYVVSGKLAVRMDDGTELEAGPGDVAWIPPGHDAWVVGDEPFVGVDFQDMTNYAKSMK